MVALEAVDSRIYDATFVVAEYQPIVDLESGETIGAEALARWPRLGVSPLDAFAAARCQDRVEELDHRCQQAAIDGTAAATLPDGFALFVNVEPGSAPGPCASAPPGTRIVAEITERALLGDPAALLRSLAALKERGCGVALDDVGAVPDTITMLPFVRPDVVKLDISLVQGRPSSEQARIMTAVAAYAERTGAAVLAEGIETAEDEDRARTLGATLGQGWHYALPGPLRSYPSIGRPLDLLQPVGPGVATPSSLLHPAHTRVGAKRHLLSISRHLEEQGLGLGSPPVVLAAFQDAAHFTRDTARRYEALAARCPLVVALGAGLPASPVRGVRGAAVPSDDPLLGEWVVVVVGSHYAGALIAADLGDTGSDADRRFRFSVTHDHDAAVQAARSLLARVDPQLA